MVGTGRDAVPPVMFDCFVEVMTDMRYAGETNLLGGALSLRKLRRPSGRMAGRAEDRGS